MTQAIPRLTFVSARADDAAAACALGALRQAEAEGLTSCAIVVGPDRDLPASEVMRALAAASGHVVHRLDPALMAVPTMQRIVQRAASESELAAIVVFGSVEPGSPAGVGLIDVLAALAAPPVICADAESFAESRGSVVQGALEAARFISAHGPAELAPPVIVVNEAVGSRRAPALQDAARLTVVATPPRSARGGDVHYAPDQFSLLIEHARRAPTLPPPVVHRRRHVRARIGLVLDDCFDLYDEESLVQFEVAGAELVALSALEGSALGELDGLIIGDGRVERHSARLSQQRGFRSAVQSAISAGVPTIASGGGYAYLTRGLRTLGGSLHPFVGAIDAEAVAIASELPRGHVDVEFTGATIVGTTGTRLRGFVQRSWLLRGLPLGEQGIYTTRSGPPDEGCGRDSLLCTHFRPYWPSCAESSITFVDRCVMFAVSRETKVAEEDREPS